MSSFYPFELDFFELRIKEVRCHVDYRPRDLHHAGQHKNPHWSVLLLHTLSCSGLLCEQISLLHQVEDVQMIPHYDTVQTDSAREIEREMSGGED